MNRVFGLDDVQGTTSTVSGQTGLPADTCTYRSANTKVDVIAFTVDYPAGSDPRRALADVTGASSNPSAEIQPAPEAGAVAAYFTASDQSPASPR